MDETSINTTSSTDALIKDDNVERNQDIKDTKRQKYAHTEVYESDGGTEFHDLIRRMRELNASKVKELNGAMKSLYETLISQDSTGPSDKNINKGKTLLELTKIKPSLELFEILENMFESDPPEKKNILNRFQRLFTRSKKITRTVTIKKGGAVSSREVNSLALKERGIGSATYQTAFHIIVTGDGDDRVERMEQITVSQPCCILM